MSETARAGSSAAASRYCTGVQNNTLLDCDQCKPTSCQVKLLKFTHRGHCIRKIFADCMIMFFSEDILSRRSGKLGLVWIAANFQPGSELHLTRREYCSVDIRKACKELLNPSRPFALRLSASLMVGVIRIYRQQTHYVYVDLKQMWQRIKQASTPQPSPIDLQDARTRSDTLPDPLKNVPLNSSFSWLGNPADLSFTETAIGSDSDFFSLTVDAMLLPPVPATPEIRPGSVAGSPFTADPKDISISEEWRTPMECLQVAVPGENDFGDGEMEGVFPSQVTLLDGVPMPVLNLNGGEEGEQGLSFNSSYSSDAGGCEDGVVLFDDESGELRVFDAGAKPQTPQPPQTPQLQTVAQTTPSQEFQRAAGSHHRPPPVGGEPERLYRKARRRLFIDKEIKMPSNTVKENINNGKSTLRRTRKIPASATVKELFSQPTCPIIGREGKLLHLWQRCAVIEEEREEGFELEDPHAHDQQLLLADQTQSQIQHTSTLTTPNYEAAARSHSNLSDLEVMRGAPGTGEVSYDDPLRNNSTAPLSDSSTANSTRNSSLRAGFETSSTQRQGLRPGKVIPPTMGGLSPIMDNELEQEAPFDQGEVAFPDFDVSYGSPTLTNISVASGAPSPFIEHKANAYRRHVTVTMGSRTEIGFQELLPKGSTRKTAGKAFSHILELINQSVLDPEQKEVYGPIMLHRGEAF